MIACVHFPRFELVVAAGGPQVLAGRALAVAPRLSGEGSGGHRVGEVSGAAEARGVTAGMLLGEALARCPDLELVPGDPVKAAEAWEKALRALESIGASVEPAHTGLAYFDTTGLRGIHGGDEQTLAIARHALARPVRMGGGPTRFCALAAALAVRSRRTLLFKDPPSSPSKEARRWLAGRPLELLGYRAETAALVQPLSRLGVRTLGELVKLGRASLGDRFGEAGVLAYGLASGQDSPLHPRRLEEDLEESMELADASSGVALGRVLGVLVSRLLARFERRGRTLRAVVLSARLISGGGWRERVVFRQALSDPERIWLALSLRLALLPAPAASLRLAVECFGPPTVDQHGLLDDDLAQRAERRARLREAVAQVRTIAGRDAALRAVCVDPDSRVPERRVVLAPVPE